MPRYAGTTQALTEPSASVTCCSLELSHTTLAWHATAANEHLCRSLRACISLWLCQQLHASSKCAWRQAI